MSSIRPWDVTEINLSLAKAGKYEVAVLPTCAVEAHNFHLPEGQDFFQATYVARQCCELAWPKCESVLCLPAIPYGVDCNLLDFPFSLHVSQDTLNAMIRDIATSLQHFGIRKLVIVNSHGGNNFTAFVRQLQCDLDIHVFVCNWWTVGKDKYHEIFEHDEDHAGEMETSVALELYPHLVEMEKAGDGSTRPFRFPALEKGWLSTSRNFGRISDQCAVGDPRQASAEKGRKYLDLVCERVSSFLVELAQAEIDGRFPHK